MTIIIDNIITAYAIARYNEINIQLKGDFQVWFFNQDPGLKEMPKTYFKYQFFGGSPFFTCIQQLEKDKEEIDRIICCGWNSHFYLYAYFFCKKNSIRFTIWSGSTKYEKSYLRFLFNPFIRYLIRHTDDYIAYGTSASEYLQSLGAKKEKIKIFLNSVDVNYFISQAKLLKKNKIQLRRKYHLAVEDKIIIFVGQLIGRKGLKELLEAVKNISLLYRNISLLIAGRGPLKNHVLKFIKTNPQVKIKYLGFVQYNQLPEVYNLSDALALPSKQEVWGLVVNEALSSGIPVLVSKYAGCGRDLVDWNNGIVIDEITAAGIEQAIKIFLKRKSYSIDPNTILKMRNDLYAQKVFL